MNVPGSQEEGSQELKRHVVPRKKLLVTATTTSMSERAKIHHNGTESKFRCMTWPLRLYFQSIGAMNTF